MSHLRLTEHVKPECSIVRCVKLSSLVTESTTSETSAAASDQEDELKNTSTESNTESDTDIYIASGSSDDIGLLNCNRVVVKRATKTDVPCTCRFKSVCARLIIDNGCNAHVTGNLELLHNIREAPSVTIENALEKVHKPKT